MAVYFNTVLWADKQPWAFFCLSRINFWVRSILIVLNPSTHIFKSTYIIPIFESQKLFISVCACNQEETHFMSALVSTPPIGSVSHSVMSYFLQPHGLFWLFEIPWSPPGSPAHGILQARILE